MSITVRRKILTLASAALAAVALVTGMIFEAVPASAATGVTVCLTNAPSQCADVKDSADTSGTRIWLYSRSDANDYHWIEVSTGCVAGSSCFYLEDAQNTSLCLSATGTNGAQIQLRNCNETGAWYDEGGNELGNGFYGAAATLITNGSASKDYLFGSRTGNWHQWTIS